MSAPTLSGLARLLMQHQRLADVEVENLQTEADSAKTPFI